MQALVRYVLLAAGVLLVGVGVIGIFVPLLPTTIFFLLAAGCFGRSSPAAYRWLMTNRLFGPRLRDYHEHHGATRATKAVSLVTLWGGLSFAAWYTGFQPWLVAVLGAVAIGVSVHLLTLRTVRRD